MLQLPSVSVQFLKLEIWLISAKVKLFKVKWLATALDV